MTTFSSSNSFGRGEIDASLHDLRGQDFYGSAAAYIENWYPDRVGGLYKRPAFDFAAEWGYEALAFPSATDSIAPSANRTVSLSGRSISFAGQAYSYESKDLYMQVVELSGRAVAIFVETLSRTYQDGAANGNCVLISAQYMRGTSVSPDVTTMQGYSAAFTNATGGVFTDGFPYNDLGLTPPLSELVRIAVAGPAAFIATGRMPLVRVYIDSGTIQVDPVSFYEELAGTITADSGGTTWTGTDSLFQDQLSAGDTILFDGKTYEIASVTSQTEFTTTAAASSASITASGAVKRSNIFGAGQFPCQVTFFQNRLVLASTRDKPTGVWLSQTSNPYVILGSNVEADSPINYELFAPEATAFRWMTSTDRIYLGGSRSEFSIGEPGTAITPTVFPVARIGTTGSSPLAAAVSDTSFLHTGRYGEHLYAVQFDLNRQAFESSDLAFLSSQIISSPIKSFSYRAASPEDPTPRVYITLEDGGIRAAAYATNLNLLAWVRVSTSNSGAKVLHVTSSSLASYFVVRDETADCYQIWVDEGGASTDVIGDFLSKARVDAQKKITVGQPFRGGVLAITSEAPNATLLGYATADASGEADLSGLQVSQGDIVQYMFSYEAQMKLLPVAASDARGAMLNRKRRLVRALVDVLDSNQIFLNARPLLPEVNPDDSLFTGVYSTRMLGWNYTDELEISAPSIYRARIRSVTREIST